MLLSFTLVGVNCPFVLMIFISVILSAFPFVETPAALPGHRMLDHGWTAASNRNKLLERQPFADLKLLSQQTTFRSSWQLWLNQWTSYVSISDSLLARTIQRLPSADRLISEVNGSKVTSACCYGEVLEVRKFSKRDSVRCVSYFS